MTARRGISWLRGCAVAAIAVVCAARCSAEPSDPNAIHAGATSIQFLAFGGSSRDIAFKTHYSDHGAIRVGVNLTLDESTGKAPSTALPHLRVTRYYTIAVSSELQQYIDTKGPVTMFVGAGPYWTKGRSSYEETEYLSGTDLFYSKSDQRFWQVGGTATAGFEWFFKRKLSVIGRVGASFAFGKTHAQDGYSIGVVPPPGMTRFHSSTASAGTSSAALGFAVYL